MKPREPVQVPPEIAAEIVRMCEPLQLSPELAAMFERLDRISASVNGKGWLRLIELLRNAADDPQVKESGGATGFVKIMLRLASDSISCATGDDAVLQLDGIMPLGEVGVKFTTGRKKDTIGPVRKAVRRALKTEPALKNRAIWEILAKRPPAGWRFIDLPDSQGGGTPSGRVAIRPAKRYPTSATRASATCAGQSGSC